VKQGLQGALGVAVSIDGRTSGVVKLGFGQSNPAHNIPLETEE